MNIRSIFMGTPEFAVPMLESLIQSSYDVVAVYTQPDKPAGRGKLLASPPTKELAMKHKIPVVQPNTLRSAGAVQELAGFHPELIVVAAFGYILPGEMLSLPEFGCLNVHPSLLPKHRGPSPVADTLLCGDVFAGVTIMLMDEALDSGPILAQRKVGISDLDTTGSLTHKLASAGTELLMETLPEWLEGRLKPQAQNEDSATYSKLIANRDGELDWRLTAVELWRRVRAFNPWPGCYTWWKGKRLKIYSATPLGDKAKGEIGKVVALPKAAPVRVGVVAGDGILGLCQIQLEGKREMSADEFTRGQRDFVGSSLI